MKIVTLDGPSGSGKGTVGRLLAQVLNFNYLDSGLLYRGVAILVIEKDIALSDVSNIEEIARNMNLEFSSENNKIFLDGIDVSNSIRTEEISIVSSKVAQLKSVRAILHEIQRGYLKGNGLIADGRDMGTVIFPDADLKIFITASPEARAYRRHKELLGRGESVSLRDLERSIASRDRSDSERKISPLVPAVDAIIIDTSNMTVEEVKDKIVKHYRAT
ncbi:MAG: (d)CMP kinase [SAR92 clade bacterium]|uniref:Cytidylate kinase n=1 Tax=SAR92 clade bacterium TaxID=2315479 RepID=A0A520LKW0_9GAMM|nr:MAG: (d)CMP kinase [SAR92 clade bacterium]